MAYKATLLKKKLFAFFSPGYPDGLHERILQVYFAGLTAGTWKNKSIQAKKYLNFTSNYNTDPLAPTQYDLLAYILHLKDSLATPGAVLNYISGAKTWVQLFGGNVAPFATYPVTLMKRGVQRLSTHVTSQAPPLSPTDLKRALDYLTTAGPTAKVMRAALLVAYYTIIRQGNLLHTGARYDPGHTMTASDITTSELGLTVTVKTTKTRWRSGQSYQILVPASPHSQYCPLQAWQAYISYQHPHPLGPAFLVRGGAPLLPAALLGALKMALAATGVTNPAAYTLHSLRRGGAQACAQAGGSLKDIMEMGSWTSSAVHTYVPRDRIQAGPRTLSTLLG